MSPSASNLELPTSPSPVLTGACAVRAADLDAHRLERHRDVGARRVPRLLRVAEEAARAEGRVARRLRGREVLRALDLRRHERAREAELARELDERVELARVLARVADHVERALARVRRAAEPRDRA